MILPQNDGVGHFSRTDGDTRPGQGASKALGTFEQGGYLFLLWQEGLEVMLWHDLTGEGDAESFDSVDGRFYIERRL